MICAIQVSYQHIEMLTDAVKTSKHVFETAVRGMLIHRTLPLSQELYLALSCGWHVFGLYRGYRCSAVSVKPIVMLGKMLSVWWFIFLFIRSNSVYILQKNWIKCFIISLFYKTSSNSQSLTAYIDLQVEDILITLIMRTQQKCLIRPKWSSCPCRNVFVVCGD